MTDEETKEAASDEKTDEVNDEEAKEEADDESADTQSPIEEANKAAERMEKANAETKKLLDRQEKIIAEQTLRGKATGGAPKVEETPKQYADRVMKNEGK